MPSFSKPNRQIDARPSTTPSAVVLIEELIADACSLGVSDIHLTQGRNTFTIRMRIDGLLQKSTHLPEALGPSVMARLKVLAGLRTDEHQLPQDGRFQHTLPEGALLDTRISVIPTHSGEHAVIRLLLPLEEGSNFSTLGLSSGHEQALTTLLQKPSGMILLTGPTGSGKTTTLYAMLRELASQPISIVTVEDPVEYSLPGITQVPIRPQAGLSFAQGLRSILRQDPDVIMIGEIRDSETARIAASAALTGHLVLATLHTTDASSALTRLKDLAVDPYLIAATVTAVLAQRLVRKLCGACTQEETVPASAHAQLLHLLGAYGPIAKVQRMGSGCKNCRYTGYTGRTGIYELLLVDNALKEAVLGGLGSQPLYEVARAGGLSTLQHDGLLKVREGVTSYKEILRTLYA